MFERIAAEQDAIARWGNELSVLRGRVRALIDADMAADSDDHLLTYVDGMRLLDQVIEGIVGPRLLEQVIENVLGPVAEGACLCGYECSAGDVRERKLLRGRARLWLLASLG